MVSMRILAIETTCDETAVSIGEALLLQDFNSDWSNYWPNFKILSHKVISQEDLHRVFGGVVPEVASRKHQETLIPLLDVAFREAGLKPEDIDLIAVSSFPGLIGAVLIGVSVAKAIALATGKPLVGVNHLWGHIYAAFLNEPPKFPFLGLVISGGHTNLYLFYDHFKVSLLGRTLDDALGEAYDKVARLLGMGYPGGPLIDRLAKGLSRDPQVELPVAMKGNDLNFSYSGLKTAVARLVRKLGNDLENFRADIAKAFQIAAIEQVISKLATAVKLTGVRRIIVGGGVSANSYLRERLAQISQELNLEVKLPPLKFCLDNASMLIPLAWVQYKLLGSSDLFLEGYPDEEEGLRAMGLSWYSELE